MDVKTPPAGGGGGGGGIRTPVAASPVAGAATAITVAVTPPAVSITTPASTLTSPISTSAVAAAAAVTNSDASTPPGAVPGVPDLKFLLLSVLWSGDEFTLRGVLEKVRARTPLQVTAAGNKRVPTADQVLTGLDQLLSDGMVTVRRGRPNGASKTAEEMYRIRSTAPAAAVATPATARNLTVTVSPAAAAASTPLSSPPHHALTPAVADRSDAVVQSEFDDWCSEHFKSTFDPVLDRLDVSTCARLHKHQPFSAQQMAASMIQLLSNCKRNTLTGCWRYAHDHASSGGGSANASPVRARTQPQTPPAAAAAAPVGVSGSNAFHTVMKWKSCASAGPDVRRFHQLFDHPSAIDDADAKSAPGEKLVVRHDPRRCEFFFGNEHRACCRPSHLCWGSADDHRRDRLLAVHLRGALGARFKHEIDAESKVWLAEYAATNGNGGGVAASNPSSPIKLLAAVTGSAPVAPATVIRRKSASPAAAASSASVSPAERQRRMRPHAPDTAPPASHHSDTAAAASGGGESDGGSTAAATDHKHHRTRHRKHKSDASDGSADSPAAAAAASTPAAADSAPPPRHPTDNHSPQRQAQQQQRRQQHRSPAAAAASSANAAASPATTSTA